ncbi:MAG: hypothetical protein HY746_06940 [Elusimicrobia bacterium]|nr:hypothetical protein [Elusimicrobiota bacterium]
MTNISKTIISASLFFYPLAGIAGAQANEPDDYFSGNGKISLAEILETPSKSPETVTAAETEPLKNAFYGSQASEPAVLTGFIARFQGKFYVGTNLYFEHRNESYLIEDFTGLQKFHLKSKELYITLKDLGEFRLGEINVDPAGLRENERVRFEAAPELNVSTFYINRKPPKVTYQFAAGITGFGFIKQVTERTEKIISLTASDGQEFCFYQNIPGRLKGVLYPEKCRK